MAENSKGRNKKAGMHDDLSKAQGAGSSNSDHQDASATRGGTTDMDHRSERNAAGSSKRANRGSGVTTKRTITGSDYDGQVTDQ